MTKVPEHLLPDGLLVLAYRGSIAHGMYVPQSDPDSIDDRDLMGVFMGEPRHYLGFGQRETIERTEGEWDVVHYELRKFIGLLLKSNPNVLSMLWLEEKNVLQSSDVWDEILRNRDLFVSKNAYRAFAGYAHSQLHRMTHPTKKGYQGAKRKALMEKFGYDTKNAAHLIRLLKMGIEYMVEGRLYVERKHDSAQLLSIKRGEWSVKRVEDYADELFRDLEKAYVSSALPNEPQREAVEKLLINILKGRLCR